MHRDPFVAPETRATLADITDKEDVGSVGVWRQGRRGYAWGRRHNRIGRRWRGGAWGRGLRHARATRWRELDRS